MYNPRGHDGPAADVAACATFLRHLVDDASVTWRWCAAVLDSAAPPAWADTHRDALAALRADVAAGETPPPGWTAPPLPGRLPEFGGDLPRTPTRPRPRVLPPPYQPPSEG
jgi:hypothetical protein